MAAIVFPIDRTGLTPAGTGPLQTGDQFVVGPLTWVYVADINAWECAAPAPDYSDLTGVPSSFAPSAHRLSHISGADLITAADIGAVEASSGTMTNGTLVNPVFDYPTNPEDDHTAKGPQTNDIQAGATIAQFDVCYLGATKWLKALADAESTSAGFLVLSLEAKNDTQAMNVALPGSIIRDDSWNWTIGGKIYLDKTTAGAMTQTVPDGTGKIVRVLGYALTADSFFFNPSSNWIKLA